MPVGAYHELIGTLASTDLGYTLYLDQGGVWLLDIPGRPDLYLGKYVRVHGHQAGFNILEVRSMGFANVHWTDFVDADERHRAPAPAAWRRIFQTLKALRHG